MMAHITTTATAPTRPRRFRLLAWLVRRNADYRQKQRLNRLDARLLDDMGMTRADVDRAFRRLHADDRYRPRMWL